MSYFKLSDTCNYNSMSVRISNQKFNTPLYYDNITPDNNYPDTKKVYYDNITPDNNYPDTKKVYYDNKIKKETEFYKKKSGEFQKK